MPSKRRYFFLVIVARQIRTLLTVRLTHPESEEEARTFPEACLWATDLSVVTPLSWYAPPAPAKLSLDSLSAWIRMPGLDFYARMLGKALRAVVVSSDEQREAEALSGNLNLSVASLKRRWPGPLLGHDHRTRNVLEDHQVLEAVSPYLRANP